jgi:hypothetical protein
LSEQPGSLPSIVGRSTDSPSFAHIVEEMLIKQPFDGFIKGQHFNTTLAQCFSSIHGREGRIVDDCYRLVGVKLDILCPNYKVTYYYCYSNEPGKPGNETVMETTENIIFRPGQEPNFNNVFHPEAVAAMRNIQVVDEDGNLAIRSIRYVLIMDIPALDVDGIFTVASTTNRPFSLTDVRFIYAEMKRFGLHMSCIRKEKLNDYQTLAGTYFHDLKSITNIGLALVKKLLNPQSSEELPFVPNLDTVADILKLAKAKIVGFQRMISLELKTFEKTQNKKWSIVKSIRRQALLLETIAKPYKGAGIWVYKQTKSISRSHVNEDVFDLCLFNLLEYAVKFSYGKESKGLVRGYDPDDKSTPGHIHVLISEVKEYVLVRIANWGCKIQDPGKVFQTRGQSTVVDHFLLQENIREVFKGDNYAYIIALWQLDTNNNGLYLVQKYITAIGGSCTCEVKGDYSRFTLKVPKEKVDVMPPAIDKKVDASDVEIVKEHCYKEQYKK